MRGRWAVRIIKWRTLDGVERDAELKSKPRARKEGNGWRREEEEWKRSIKVTLGVEGFMEKLNGEKTERAALN
jgi:hypothetical protein